MDAMIETARTSIGVLRDHTRMLGQMNFRDRDTHVMAIHRALDALQAEVIALTAERDAAMQTLVLRNAEYDALSLTLQLRDDQVVRTQRALMEARVQVATVLQDYWKMIPPLNRLHLRSPSDSLTPLALPLTDPVTGDPL